MNPGGAVVVDGVIRTTPPDRQATSAKKIKPTKKTPKLQTPTWGKQPQQTQKIKPNQNTNNMHRQAERKCPRAKTPGIQGLQAPQPGGIGPFQSHARRSPGPFSAVLPLLCAALPSAPAIFGGRLLLRGLSRGAREPLETGRQRGRDRRYRFSLNAGDGVPTSNSFSNTRGV